MIQFFRKALSSWVVLALLAVVLVAFVVTGVGDPFGGGSRAGVMSRVGATDITEAEFTNQWRRAVERIRAQNPQITPEQAAREGGVDALLGELEQARALETFATAQGVRAGAGLVDAEIAAVPSFQFGGRFSQQAYEEALRAQRLTDREVREGLEGDLLRRQLLAPVGAGTKTPVAMADTYARIVLEGRRGLIGVVPTAAMALPPPPTDAALARFYAAEKAAFTLPERRIIRYALIEPTTAAAPSEAEIAAYYATNAAKYGAIEKRRLAQAVVPDEAVATRLAASAGNAAGFAASARRNGGLAAADIAIGERSESEFAAATNAAVARAAFAAPIGGVTRPIKSDFGWHVVAVEASVGGQATPLAAVRAEIAATLAADRRAAAAAELGDEVQGAMGKGASFADLVARFRLTAVTTPPLTKAGLAADGTRADPALAPILIAAFETDPGDDASLEDLSGGRAALVETSEVIAAELPPLAARRAEVARLWAARAQVDAARTMAQAIAREVSGGKPMAAALAERRLPPPQPVGGRRLDLSRARPDQIPAPVLLLFQLPGGAVRALPDARGQGAFVVQVVAIIAGDPAADPSIVGNARTQLARAQAGEFAQQFARAAAAEAGVKRNAQLVTRVTRRLSGQADASTP